MSVTAAIMAMAAAVASPTAQISDPTVGLAVRMSLPAADVKNCLDTLKDIAGMTDQMEPGDPHEAQSGSVTCTDLENGGVRIQDGTTQLSLVMTGPTAELTVKATGINMTFNFETGLNGAVVARGRHAIQWRKTPTAAFATVKTIFAGPIKVMFEHLNQKQQRQSASASAALTR